MGTQSRFSFFSSKSFFFFNFYREGNRFSEVKGYDLSHNRGADIGTQFRSLDSLFLYPHLMACDEFKWWMRRSCHELPASLTAGTPSLSDWPLVFHGKPLCWGSCQQEAKALYCPYLELLSLKLDLLLQNMFILVSSPCWLPDQCEPKEQQLQLSAPGQAG